MEHPKMVVGLKIERWTVVKVGAPKSLCRCTCGRELEVWNGNLLLRRSKSCIFCARKGNLNSRQGCKDVPGSLYRRLLNTVNNAIARCSNEELPQWKDYGGRGIKVYLPWQKDFHLFITYLTTLLGHDNPKLLLDRKDNDRGYYPGNLRFVTRSVSSINRRPYVLSNRRADG